MIINLNKYRKQDRSEKIAVNYIFFRSYSIYLIMSIPFIIGVFMFNNSLIHVSKTINEYLEFGLYNFSKGIIIGIIILTNIFIIYRWLIHRINGSYGYWLSMGIDRQKFIIYTVIYFMFYNSISIIIGILIIQLQYGVHIGFLQTFLLILRLISDLILILGMSLLICEVIKSPSIATFLFLGINTLIFYLLERNASINKILLSNIFIIFNILFGLLFIAIAIYLQLRAEFDLRGNI